MLDETRLQELRTMPYQAYLQTSEWKEKRGQVLERASHRCQLCYSPDDLNVHHRTYKRRGNEDLGDLTVLCKVCHERFHDRMPIDLYQARLIESVYGNANIPYKARNWEFSTFPSAVDQKAKYQIEQFVQFHKDGKDEYEKRAIYISGKLGTGKTGLAICALKEFIKAGHLALFVSILDLVDRLRTSYGRNVDETQDELLKAVTEVPFLVLDDLGVEKPTAYVLERLYLIVDKRQSKELYTIFTSNLSTKDLEAYWRPSDVQEGMFHPGLRIVERIREYCQGVSIRGGNLRDAGW